MRTLIRMIALVVSIVVVSNAVEINDKLLSKVESGEPADVLVTFSEGPQTVHAIISEINIPRRSEKITLLRESLIELAKRTQANVIEILVRDNFGFQSLWISNQIFIRAATPLLIKKLGSLGAEVVSISEVQTFQLDRISDGGRVHRENGVDIAGRAWGVSKVGANKAQLLLRSFHSHHSKSKQIIVSNIDTGVRFSHEALRDNFIGDYGWFDPYDGTNLPVDLDGHGTHTMGTICGQGGIGVFPDAKWLACKGCGELGCGEFELKACAQFILCPTLPDQSTPNCSMAPHVVSNSWGGGQGDGFYDSAIAAFHIAGIIPVFSIGNSGPACGTASSPGDRDVISVGSTTQRDELSYFSSRGPSVDGTIKPDISAPGSNMLSSWNSSDNAYEVLSGTSMACPHVSGAVALMLSQNPNLTYAQVREHLFFGAETNLPVYGLECGDILDNVLPNNYFGHGRLDIYQSLKGLIHRSGN